MWVILLGIACVLSPNRHLLYRSPVPWNANPESVNIVISGGNENREMGTGFYPGVCVGRALVIPGIVCSNFVLRMDGSDLFIQSIGSLWYVVSGAQRIDKRNNATLPFSCWIYSILMRRNTSPFSLRNKRSGKGRVKKENKLELRLGQWQIHHPREDQEGTLLELGSRTASLQGASLVSLAKAVVCGL